LIRRMGLSDLRNKPYSKSKRYFCPAPLSEPNVYGLLDPRNKYRQFSTPMSTKRASK
jgi:hypothetical protein